MFSKKLTAAMVLFILVLVAVISIFWPRPVEAQAPVQQHYFSILTPVDCEHPMVQVCK